ncbi:MAG: ABC transporter substrate-binding protein [Hyphomicrobiaceae bacterium]
MTNVRQLQFPAAVLAFFLCLVDHSRAASPPIVALVALASRDEAQIEGLKRGLVENGIAPGRAVRLEVRFANGDREQMRRSIVELTGAGARVFVAAGPSVARMVQEISKDSMVVVASLDGFEAAGVSGTIPRPSGNITGFATLAADLIGKRLELLREIMPGLTSVVAVTHTRNRNHPQLVAASRRAADRFGLGISILEVAHPDEVAPGLSAAYAKGARAVLFMRDYMFESHRTQLVAAASTTALASSFDEEAFVRLGGLMSYAPDRPDLFRRSASYVAKLLAGARPADLPIQQPTKFELFVNLKTAKTLGLAIPPSILVRADEVIE